MANHFSALKRARQTEKRTVQNRINKSRFRTALRKFRAAVQAGDHTQAKTLFGDTVSLIDKAAKQGVIHKNTAARHKSRLTKHVSELA